MKKKIYKIAAKFGKIIRKYNTYKSDMGCQCYEVEVNIGYGKVLVFNDSYFIGSGESHKVLTQFEYELSNPT